MEKVYHRYGKRKGTGFFLVSVWNIKSNAGVIPSKAGKKQGEKW